MEKIRLPMLILSFVFFAVATHSQTTTSAQQPSALSTNEAAVKYGSNPAAGKTFTHDGIQLYY